MIVMSIVASGPSKTCARAIARISAPTRLRGASRATVTTRSRPGTRGTGADCRHGAGSMALGSTPTRTPRAAVTGAAAISLTALIITPGRVSNERAAR